ncbi:MAG: DUF2442 domain-containing protein [Anaerolineae bacterium]|nr:DUF2442 domain-containing protein [Anaerolineae bacterium]
MSVTARAIPKSVSIHSGRVWVTLEDQRVIGLPLAAFPWLENATPEHQQHYRANPISIYWPDLEDGIDMEYFTGEWPLPADVEG